MNQLITVGTIQRAHRVEGGKGKPFLSITLVSERRFRDKTFTDYTDIKLYPRDLDDAESRCAVGSLACASGEARAEVYEGNDGKPKAKLSMVAFDIATFGNPGSLARSLPAPSKPPIPAEPSSANPPEEPDDVPF